MRTSIVLCFDKNYGGASCTTILSVLLNNPTLDYDIDLICSSTTEDFIAALDYFRSIFNKKINLHMANDSYFYGFKTTPNIPIATYLRFLIPELVENQLIIYIDSDVIVQTKFDSIINEANQFNKIYGVEDLSGKFHATKTLGLAEGEPYLNAGVLIFNNDYWRKNTISKFIIEYYKENESKITWLDQCAINGALSGSKIVIDSKYNYLYQDMDNNLKQDANFNCNYFNGIMHYNSTTKPWHLWCKKEYRNLWLKYSNLSPMIQPEIELPRSHDEWYKMALLHEDNKNYENSSSLYKQLYNLNKN